jgi:hypothetical protein
VLIALVLTISLRRHSGSACSFAVIVRNDEQEQGQRGDAALPAHEVGD